MLDKQKWRKRNHLSLTSLFWMSTIGKNTVLWSGTVVRDVATLVMIVLYILTQQLAQMDLISPCPQRGLVKIHKWKYK
jgi:hypothetical protein